MKRQISSKYQSDLVVVLPLLIDQGYNAAKILNILFEFFLCITEILETLLLFGVRNFSHISIHDQAHDLVLRLQ